MAEEEKTKKEEIKKEDKPQTQTEKTPEEKKSEEKVEKKINEQGSSEEKEGDKEVSTPAITKAKEKASSTTKKTEKKTDLEREYVVPLRRGSSKVPAYRRAKKAIRTLKEFIARHMRVENRDLRKVKIDLYLNNEIWHRGIKKPLHKVTVKAIKNTDGTVNVSLSELPAEAKFAKARMDKRTLKASMAKIKGTGAKAPTEKEPEKTEEQKTDSEEKEKATQEAGKARQKAAAKKAAHTSKGSHKQKTAPVRKALKK